MADIPSRPIDQLPPLTLADQVFVNALASALLIAAHEPKRQATYRDIARDVRPQVTRDHRFVSPLINSFTAWDSAVSAIGSRDADPFAPERCRWRLVEELRQFFSWRCALADAALQAKGAAA